MKNLFLIANLFFSLTACQKEESEQVQPAATPDTYQLHFICRDQIFNLNATDSIGLYEQGKKVGLTLFFETAGFSLRGYYHYNGIPQRNAAGLWNDTSFVVRDTIASFCNGPQQQRVEFQISRLNK